MTVIIFQLELLIDAVDNVSVWYDKQIVHPIGQVDSVIMQVPTVKNHKHV